LLHPGAAGHRPERPRTPSAGGKPVAVDRLSPLARLFVRQNTRYVSTREAAAARGEAMAWATELFDDKSARPWISTLLRPGEAAYLARHGVCPDLLQLPYEHGPGGNTESVELAIRLGDLSPQRLIDLLRATGRLPESRGQGVIADA